jgi:hypothetical protein
MADRPLGCLFSNQSNGQSMEVHVGDRHQHGLQQTRAVGNDEDGVHVQGLDDLVEGDEGSDVSPSSDAGCRRPFPRAMPIWRIGDGVGHLERLPRFIRVEVRAQEDGGDTAEEKKREAGEEEGAMGMRCGGRGRGVRR